MIRTIIFFILFTVSVGCAQNSSVTKMVDGERRVFSYQQGNPIPAENETVKVKFIGPLLLGKENYKRIIFMWGLTLEVKNGGLNSVHVYDITTKKHELIISNNNPKILKNGNCHLESVSVDFYEKNVPWFFIPNDTEKIFKIVINSSENVETIFYQPCVIRAEMKGNVLSRLVELTKKNMTK